MSDVFGSDHTHELPSLARRLDRVCTQFESACKDGGRPRIEDFLHDTPEPEQSTLLRELILLDIDYRRFRASTSHDEIFP